MTVGFAELDADHERIIGSLNSLVEALDNRAEHSEIDRLFTDLMKVVEGHFVREERVMAECHYDGLPYHVQEHSRLRERLLEIHAGELHEPDETLRVEVRKFLTNWLYGHVLVDDFAYRGYLNEQRESVTRLLDQTAG